jgi:hypothetical protein
MSKLDRPKFNVDLEGGHSPDYIWKLHRLNDGLIRTSFEVGWLEFDENGKFKQRHDAPEVGRSLLMSPFNTCFSSQTTDIIELINANDNLVEFKTTNSTYKLERIPNPDIK